MCSASIHSCSYEYTHTHTHTHTHTRTVSYGRYCVICGLHLLLSAIRRAELMSSYNWGLHSFVSEQTPHAPHACNYRNCMWEARKNIPWCWLDILKEGKYTQYSLCSTQEKRNQTECFWIRFFFSNHTHKIHKISDTADLSMCLLSLNPPGNHERFNSANMLTLCSHYKSSRHAN